MENKDIDKLFRQTLGNADQEVNPAIWKNIEKELDKKAKKRVPVIFKTYNWINYAAAVLIVLGIGFFLFKNKPTDNIIAELPSAKQEKPLMQTVLPSIMKSTEQGDISANETVSISTKSIPVMDTKDSHKIALKKSTPRDTISPEHIGDKEELSIVALSSSLVNKEQVQTNTINHLQTNLPTTQVTEIEPIRPLIVLEEEEESMYAITPDPLPKESTVITTILNKLSENIELKSKKEVRFKSDDEGSIFIDLINPLAKNRNKKRK